MRTTVEVDGALLDEARHAAGLRTDEETALRLLLRLQEQQEMLGLAGEVRWTGDVGWSRSAGDRGGLPPMKSTPNGKAPA